MKRYLTLLLAFLLAACGQSAPAGLPAPVTKTVDGISVTLAASQNPSVNAAQEWVVTLKDAAGQPITGADVFLDLLMPAMPMGQNKPLATPRGDGTYVAQGVYSMSGAWHVVVHAEIAGTEHEIVFEVDVP